MCLHGFPDFWYAWRHQFPALVDAGYRVIAPDMRGYNLSSKPTGARHYRLDALVDDVSAIVAHFALDDATIVGHDCGGGGIAEIGKTDRMYAFAEVDERDAPRVRVGQRATVSGGALSTPLTGVVTDVATWRNPENGRALLICLVGFDVNRPTLATPEVNARLGALAMPDAVLVDAASRPEIGPIADWVHAVYRILYTDITDHLAEYAALKAIGYSDLRLIGIIFREAVILASLGFLPGLLIALALYVVTRNATNLPMQMTPGRVAGVLALTIAMCCGSGALAARRL